jgi:cation diffusion facilitator CzcD-associated flavoprotein CzcO
MMADRKFRVVVAGAGVSGLFMAETLKRAQIDCTIPSGRGSLNRQVEDPWVGLSVSEPA